MITLSLARRPTPGAPVVCFAHGGPKGPDTPLKSDPCLATAREDGFLGTLGQTMAVRPRDGRPADRVLWVGLGPREEFDGRALRLAGASAMRRLAETRWGRAVVCLPDTALSPAETLRGLAEGLRLADYRFDRYKSEPASPGGVSSLRLFAVSPPAGHRTILMEAVHAAHAMNYCRDLVNTPAQDKTPSVLARQFKRLAGPSISVKVHPARVLERWGAGALLGVGRGSDHPPVLVHACYKPKGAPKGRVTFVGKGVTFDSGGLSLKPAEAMTWMKYDMAGSAVVMSLFKVLSQWRPPVEVHGVVALAENMPGPRALKPGDVVRATNGVTIEVLNTDAEGRLILADALCFASTLPPGRVIDVATLTGAATVALGKSCAALMTDRESLEKDLRLCADQAGERLWPLPLEKSYEEHIKSKVADLKNIGQPGEAGTIVGGLFLKHFAGGKEWAHVDMAGVGWNPQGSPLSPPGATGAMVRTFLRYISRQAGGS